MGAGPRRQGLHRHHESRRCGPRGASGQRASASPGRQPLERCAARGTGPRGTDAADVDPARYDIVPFPLDEPARWPALVPGGTPQLVRVFTDWEREKLRRFEAAGYPVVALQGDPARRISATDIRAALASGAPWQHWVPPGARELLASWTSAAA
jgi:hypothetical protein